MIEVRGLSRKYGTQNRKKTILDHLDLRIKQGEMAAIMGAAGCGKTTLLKIIGGMDAEFEGEVFIEGKALSKLGEKALDQYRMEKTGFIFQDYSLLEGLTIRENILLPMIIAHREAEMEEAYIRLDIDPDLLEVENGFISEISGGQQQKTAVYRALIKNPPIVLADEPTGNLDMVSTKKVMELLKKCSQKKKAAVLLVTHDLYAASYCDSVYMLKDGRLDRHIGRQNLSEEEFMKKIVREVEDME